ncbi:MAG: hypothetical protein IKF90_06695 [Parasporobacterium sp.]|nr:hypothetical protein [Parasporobacterium sp.]
MNTYKKPVAEKISFTYENQVVTASDGCYTATAYIHQKPETGRGDYRIQVNGVHSATHSCDHQTLHISFNMPVQYSSSQGTLVSGDGTTTLNIDYSYHNNGNDNIGLGDLCVIADAGLAVTSVSITDIPN